MMTHTSREPVHIDLVAGARPNFIKLAPVAAAFTTQARVPFRIIHTGQHYDPAMSGVFFEELSIPRPFAHLEVGSGSHGAQTGRLLERYERHLIESRPAATVVFGDVNSTVACALAASKLGVPVVHVEAGLRSGDRTMPEEINRIVTDVLSDLLLVSEPSGLENLRREGVPDAKVRLVGNVMIDTLVRELDTARALHMPARYGLADGGYAMVTLHRPSNVDEPPMLEALLRLLRRLSEQLPMLFAVHPRTRLTAERHGLTDLLADSTSFRCLGPLPYRENLGLLASARLVLTDSGGIQEETSALGVPCLTLRENTERPVTVEVGSSCLVGRDVELIESSFLRVIAGQWKTSQPIPLWDGHAGARVATAVCEWLDQRFGRQ